MKASAGLARKKDLLFNLRKMSQNVRFSGMGAGGGDPQPNVINNPVATALSESGALPRCDLPVPFPVDLLLP